MAQNLYDMVRRQVILGELRLSLAEESVVGQPRSRIRCPTLSPVCTDRRCEDPEGAEDQPQSPGTLPSGRHGKGPIKSSSSSRQAFISSH